MSKRPRRKRPKRSGRSRDGQRRQKLSKKVKELYPPESSADADPDWHAGLEEELDTPRRRRGRARPAPAAPDAGSEAGSPAGPTAGPPDGPELRGRVVAISSGACRVASGGRERLCVLPSELARDQRANLAVGDVVDFSAHGEGTYRIHRVRPRRTTLSRPDPQNPHRERVIAANIDAAVHVASVVEPPLRPALIDRYLIAIERGGAEAAVCVNKIDLLPDAAARGRELECLAPYRELGLQVLPCSARTGEGLGPIRALLAGRTAVFVGHSGVGKSSLLNALSPGLLAETGPLADSVARGRHTTTRSSLYRLDGGIRVIDTPGIREFGLWQLTPEELRAYFPEFARHAAGCRFTDCSHRHEPDCAVRAAVEAGDVARARHETYLRILESLETDATY